MKHFFMLLVVMMSLTLFSSCQKEDEIIPGIIYTNDPPEEIFGNSIYATTNKCWIEKNDFTISAKNLGWNTNQFWDQERQYYVSYDSGEWYLVPARKYWGIMNGIIYLSESKDWYVMSPQNYLDGWNNVQKKNTIVGYSCTGCQNPFGKSSITGFE